MHVKVMERLRCSDCKGKLELRPFEEEQIAFGGAPERVIKEGALLCAACAVWYPLTNYVPIMLVFETPLHRSFAAKQAANLKEIVGRYAFPKWEPQKGEASVQRSFTDQWDIVQEDALTFAHTAEELVELNKKVWLRWTQKKPGEVKSILNVGVGLGQESVAVQETVGKDAELYGIDLNLAVIRRGSRMKTRSNLHLIVASLFAVPFERNSFDLVYTQGVLMMTYSTKEAVRSIAAYVKPGGYLFVWIYGLDDHLVPKGFIGLLARFRYWLEIFRPLVSESPRFLRNIFFGVLTPLTHPLIKSREHNKPQWKMKNTAHALRDWFSHRYAHRHSYNELIEWYEDLGFEIVDVQSPGAYRKLFGRRLAGAGLTGRRVGGTLTSRTAQA